MDCLLYVFGCSAASHWLPAVPPPSCGNQKFSRHYHMFIGGAKSPLVENHCYKLQCSPHPHGMWCREEAINQTERDARQTKEQIVHCMVIYSHSSYISPLHTGLPGTRGSLASLKREKLIGPVLCSVSLFNMVWSKFKLTSNRSYGKKKKSVCVHI